MNRRSNLARLCISVGLIITCLFILFSTVITHSAIWAEPADGWLSSQAPAIQLISETTGDQAKQQTQPACTRMTIPVVRTLYQQLLTNNEDHCMYHTAAGLVDYALTIIQPNGFSKAYPLSWQVPGKPIFVPVPNSPNALALTYPAGGGVYAGLYKDFGDSLAFNGNILSPGFTIGPADMSFKHPDGPSMPFEISNSLSFSGGGAYMAAEGLRYGFVRINLATLDMTTFAPNTPLDGSGMPTGAATAISPDGDFAAIAYNAHGGWGSKYFKLVDIDSCGSASGIYSAQVSTCQNRDYLPELQQAIPGLVNITNISFATESSLNFVAESKVGGVTKYERYAMTAAGKTYRLEQYLAMGDSYASGEGTFNYIDGTDTDINKCHQSISAYAFIMMPRAGSTESVACAGATMDNVLLGLHQKETQLKGLQDSDITVSQRDEAIAKHIPGVISQDRFITLDNPQVVTLSIGGNDIGFSDIIKRCIVPFDNFSSPDQDCYATYEDRLELVNSINDQFNNLVQTYSELQAGDTTRRIYVIGYPQIVEPDGDCGVNVRLSQTETEFASQLISYLDSVIQQAAAKAGVGYVDAQHAFDGRRLCDSGQSLAVNGLTAGNDKDHLIGNESYHPDVLGYQLLANTILAQTHNLTDPMPAPQNVPNPAASADLPILQNVPHTSRTINRVVNTGNDIFVGVSGIINFSTDQFTNLLRPNSPFEAVLHSEPTNLGTIQTSGNGTLSGQLQLPPHLPPGIHTLHLYGKSITGQTIDVQATVYVQAAFADYDGDGIANQTDACPYIVNSRQDVDQDGIDDACDGVIGPAPAIPNDDHIDSSQQSSNMPALNQSILLSGSSTNGLVSQTSIAPNDIAQALQPSVDSSGDSNILPLANGQVLGDSYHGPRTSDFAIPAFSENWPRVAAVSVLSVLIMIFGWRLVKAPRERSSR